MNDDIDPDRQREVTDKGLAKDEEQILSEHRGRYRPHAYRNVFYPPQSGTWKSRVGKASLHGQSSPRPRRRENNRQCHFSGAEHVWRRSLIVVVDESARV